MSEKKDKIGGIMGEVLKRVPKGGEEMADAILHGADRIRASVQSSVAAEITKAFSQIDINKIVEDIAENYTFDVSAKISLEPKKDKKAKK